LPDAKFFPEFSKYAFDLGASGDSFLSLTTVKG